MTTKTREVRESVVLGHRLKVRLSDDGSWGVAVDGEQLGEQLGVRHLTAYSAWAVGAAESYRLGRVTRFPPLHG